MDWKLVVVLACAVVGVLLLKRASFVSADKASELLRQGALVIDVRSPEEFQSGHLAGVINVPLGDLRTEAPRQFPDRSQVLLLHCLSGVRSGMARQQLKAIGYANSFNLGSYARAARVVRSVRGAAPNT